MPVWEDPALMAEDGKDYKYNAADARRFLEALTRRLDVDDSFIMTALEDVFYYLWKERKLPANVDPLDSKLEDPIERAGLARVFEEGLGKTVGYVIPLRRIPTMSGTPHWTSQPWFLRRSGCFWCPATRQWVIGCRSIRCRGPGRKMWSGASIPTRSNNATNFRRDRRASVRRSRSRRRPAGERRRPREKQGSNRRRKANRPHGYRGRRFARQVRARESCNIFMPPVEYLADYLDLVAAIEDTAALYGKCRWRSKAITPPYDPRMAGVEGHAGSGSD